MLLSKISFYPFLSDAAFYFLVLSIVITIIITKVENNRIKNKLKKWVYISLILSLVSALLGRFADSKILNSNQETIDTLKGELSNVQDLKHELKESQDEVKIIRDSLNSVISKRNYEDSLFRIKSDKLEKKNEELDVRTKQREIHQTKVSDLIRTLSLYKGNKIQITSLMSDPETLMLASQLSSIFSKSGWDVMESSFQNIYPVVGVLINIEDKKFTARAEFIYKALQIAGLNLKPGSIDKNNILFEVEILVGTNPDKMK